VSDSDSRFEAFAAREPYFAILASPKFLRANLTKEREAEFFDSGQEIVDWIVDVIDQRISPHFSPMSVLEYGSGIGRLAIPFGKRPGHVTAVDRSPAMLELGRREAEKQGVFLDEDIRSHQLLLRPAVAAA
jgi:SAM-dependent methyltransferase